MSGVASTPNDWILVDRELPAPDMDVWVYDGEHAVTIGYLRISDYRGPQFRWFSAMACDGDGDHEQLYAVTHWQPLVRPGEPQA